MLSFKNLSFPVWLFKSECVNITPKWTTLPPFSTAFVKFVIIFGSVWFLFCNISKIILRGISPERIFNKGDNCSSGICFDSFILLISDIIFLKYDGFWLSYKSKAIWKAIKGSFSFDKILIKVLDKASVLFNKNWQFVIDIYSLPACLINNLSIWSKTADLYSLFSIESWAIS